MGLALWKRLDAFVRRRTQHRKGILGVLLVVLVWLLPRPREAWTWVVDKEFGDALFRALKGNINVSLPSIPALDVYWYHALASIALLWCGYIATQMWRESRPSPSAPLPVSQPATEPFVPLSMSLQMDSNRLERQRETFAFLQGDFGTKEYTRAELDQLTASDRRTFFARYPEAELWWHGRPRETGHAWPRFRFPGGNWITRTAFFALPDEKREELIGAYPLLTDWSGGSVSLVSARATYARAWALREEGKELLGRLLAERPTGVVTHDEMLRLLGQGNDVDHWRDSVVGALRDFTYEREIFLSRSDKSTHRLRLESHLRQLDHVLARLRAMFP